MSERLATELIAALPPGTGKLFNPYTDSCAHDAPGNGPRAKRDRLAAHLDCDPRWILVGEAPGYQGCRHSGVAFTSERLLLDGAIPRVPRATERLTDRPRPFSEPSATIVWRALYAQGMAESVVMWNALQLHPVGDRGPWSNRTPSPEEFDRGLPALQLLVGAFPRAQVVAVGRKAEGLLGKAGIAVRAVVRHPANGGATEFANGLRELVANGA